RRIARGLDLHLVDEVGDDRLRRGAVDDVRRLDAVDALPVLRRARAVNRYAARLRLVVGSGRLRDEGCEIAVMWDEVHAVRADRRRLGVALHVYDRRLGRHLDGLRHAGEAKREIYFLDFAQLHDDVRYFAG